LEGGGEVAGGDWVTEEPPFAILLGVLGGGVELDGQAVPGRVAVPADVALPALGVAGVVIPAGAPAQPVGLILLVAREEQREQRLGAVDALVDHELHAPLAAHLHGDLLAGGGLPPDLLELPGRCHPPPPPPPP